ncbi:hypothetical protein QJS10_CPB22g00974 [Acorus calamus]|uniref:Uncharacterized protein n=1 Tax=Acorus calamus TaxID=4465 RepID=A0AAV9BZD4_ACOCL|nr:hypothetical protein QJS10_CPB22g00974 [Acorus calamus]
MPLADFLFINIKDTMVREFNHFFRYETSIASLKTSLHEFKRAIHALQTRVDDDEGRGLTRTHTVKAGSRSRVALEAVRGQRGEGRDAGDAEVRTLAEAVVRNCGGVPGKLIECACALAGKRTVAEWKRRYVGEGDVIR